MMAGGLPDISAAHSPEHLEHAVAAFTNVADAAGWSEDGGAAPGHPGNEGTQGLRRTPRIAPWPRIRTGTHDAGIT
jgi:hypothetical protein